MNYICDHVDKCTAWMKCSGAKPHKSKKFRSGKICNQESRQCIAQEETVICIEVKEEI